MKKLVGTLELILGNALYAVSLTLVIPQFRDVFWGDVGFAAILCYLVGSLGIWATFSIFFSRGLRHFQPSAAEVLEKDRRPPVLYLRSFIDEPLSQRLGIKTSVVAFMPHPRIENSIAPLFNCLGPFIAIGKPGESLPQTGAYRLYVAENEWKEKVSELMRRSRLVVLLAHAASKGIQWELQNAISTLRPEQLVLFFPPTTEDREEQYQRFRETAGSCFPCELPAKLESAYFIRFKGDWVPDAPGVAHKKQIVTFEASFLAVLRGVEPNFKKPPIWKLVGIPRLCLGGTIAAITLAEASYAIYVIIAS